MLTYQTLDRIADSYNPLLAFIGLILIIAPLANARWRISLARFFGAVSVLVIAYGIMFLDNKLKIWPAVGLDYSTHSAVAFALVAFLCATVRNLWPLWVGSLVAYVLLMLYQKYHTPLDILSTVAAVMAPVALVVVYFGRYLRVSAPRARAS